MIAGDAEYRSSGLEEASEGFSEVLKGLGRMVCLCLLREQVACDEQNIHALFLADFCHPLDTAAQMLGARLTAQAVIEVPVGCM
jgi:hypothetical protein